MKKLIVAAIAGATFSTSVTFSTLALAQGTTPGAKGTVQSAPAADVMPNTPGVDHKSKGKLSNGEFIEKAGMAGLAEIKLSNLALDKSNTPVIRDFANMMVKDHTAANQQLKKAATSSGIAPPQGIDPAHTELLQKLAGLMGREFDAAYVNVMKQDHDTAIALFENAAGDQSLDPALREFATKTLEKLRDHQLQAHNLPSSPGTGPQK